jgi:hypothetical protein
MKGESDLAANRMWRRSDDFDTLRIGHVPRQSAVRGSGRPESPEDSTDENRQDRCNDEPHGEPGKDMIDRHGRIVTDAVGAETAPR